MPPEAIAAGCIDIASQLVGLPYGDGIDVVLGGGRAMFIAETADPEDEGKTATAPTARSDRRVGRRRRCLCLEHGAVRGA
ncbi:MAG: hypothetical protein R3F55_14625 [Alphaproteobacteria bacterium]